MYQTLQPSSKLQQENEIFITSGQLKINFSKAVLARTPEEAKLIMEVLTHELTVLMKEKFELNLLNGSSLELDVDGATVEIEDVYEDTEDYGYVNEHEESVMLQTQEALIHDFVEHTQKIEKYENISQKSIATQKASEYNEK